MWPSKNKEVQNSFRKFHSLYGQLCVAPYNSVLSFDVYSIFLQRRWYRCPVCVLLRDCARYAKYRVPILKSLKCHRAYFLRLCNVMQYFCEKLTVMSGMITWQTVKWQFWARHVVIFLWALNIYMEIKKYCMRLWLSKLFILYSKLRHIVRIWVTPQIVFKIKGFIRNNDFCFWNLNCFETIWVFNSWAVLVHNPWNVRFHFHGLFMDVQQIWYGIKFPDSICVHGAHHRQ